MSLEEYLTKEMRKLSILDIGLIKTVYFLVGLLIFSLYPVLRVIDWWFYLILALASASPLWIHLFSQEGGYMEKARAYLKTNNPSNQFLLFLSVFFFAIMLGIIFPVLVSFTWWIYIIPIAILGIKPLKTTWCW